MDVIPKFSRKFIAYLPISKWWLLEYIILFSVELKLKLDCPVSDPVLKVQIKDSFNVIPSVNQHIKTLLDLA